MEKGGPQGGGGWRSFLSDTASQTPEILPSRQPDLLWAWFDILNRTSWSKNLSHHLPCAEGYCASSLTIPLPLAYQNYKQDSPKLAIWMRNTLIQIRSICNFANFPRKLYGKEKDLPKFYFLVLVKQCVVKWSKEDGWFINASNRGVKTREKKW